MKNEVLSPNFEAAILCLNCGSSSLRFALYKRDEVLDPILTGKFERIGSPDAGLSIKNIDTNQSEKRRIDAPNHVDCIPLLVEVLEKSAGTNTVTAIGHRVVHGGPRYREPQGVDEPMLEELRRITSVAPNHLPTAITLLEEFAAKYPQVPQFACFDTAFHQTMPRVARLLPIPRCYDVKGIQRYGFHGLSYAYLMGELARLDDSAATTGRVILAHLGHGTSMAAVLDGKSQDTSMGFTPASGLIMGTRSGDLDPGLIHYLAHTEGMTTAQFQHMVNHDSGLRGISMMSSDMQDLLVREATDVRAAEAVALFCYEVKKRIGSYAAVLGGLDTLVFAGGIGENAPLVRARICEGLAFLGIEIDAVSNAGSAAVISGSKSRVIVRVIHTDEELMIARSVNRLLLSAIV